MDIVVLYYRVFLSEQQLHLEVFVDQDRNWLASVDNNQLDDSNLPETLKIFYREFAEAESGSYDNDYIGGLGFGVSNAQIGPMNITIDSTRVSIVDTRNYNSDKEYNVRLIVLQGYAQISIFDRFYASCILIGKSSPQSLPGIVKLVDHLSKTDEEREELKRKEIDEVAMESSFYVSIYNDPVHEAESTCGVYIIADEKSGQVSCDAVLQAIGVADFADNTAFGLAIAISADINTFTNTMNFSLAASVRFANSERITVAGELGILNNKINSISITVKSAIRVATEIYLTYMHIGVKGFQEPKLAISLGGGIAVGEKIKVPSGLGLIKKALFPNLKDFYPLELTVDASINPVQDYFSFSGQGVFMGNLAVSASLQYDSGNFDAVLKAGTVRNKYISGSLTVDFHQRSDNWNIHANFSCSVSMDWKNFLGITVSGGIDLMLTSQNYTVNNATYNRKDLKITVAGMGSAKIFFTVSFSVQKTWVFNLSNTKISSPDLLMRSITSGQIDLNNEQDVLVCESDDIIENQNVSVNVTGSVIDAKGWYIDSLCSDSGIVKLQVAAQYTLADTDWRLTVVNNDGITVYTSENSKNIISVQNVAHNYYELIIDNPLAGDWTLEILGDKKNSGGLYLDALKDEKIITSLELVEQTESTIKFKYSAYTNSSDDHTLIQLIAEEISPASENPFYGVIAYLEETENGEFIWEIPGEFYNNSQYRFYISATSSDAAVSTDSNRVETSIERLDAELDCSWNLVYSAEDTNTVTAYITISNSGKEAASYQWELLDYTNTDTIEPEDVEEGNTAPAACVIASGSGETIAGNSTITFTQTITITNELLDNPSSLQLTVTKCTANESSLLSGDVEDGQENYADDADDITFTALNSMYSQSLTIHWDAVEGASGYLLQYALDGDWDNSGVFINGIKDTSYTLSAAPGEYSCRAIAVDADGKMMGSWSEVEEVEILYSDRQTLEVIAGIKSSDTQTFSLNDGIYSFTGDCGENFSGSVILYRNKISKKNNNSIKITTSKILTLTFVNGKLINPVSDILLDHGDYFWEWKRKGKDISSDSGISIQLTGKVFPAEDKDREYTIIGGEDSEVAVNSDGINTETLEGAIGFFNKDAVYQYITDDGGELSLTIKGNTVVDAAYKIYIYVQSDKSNKFTRVKSLTVKAGEYDTDTVILNDLAVKNNFYIQIVSRDNGKGKYNTDYALDLSFDAFEDSEQKCDILEVDGAPVQEWIGYRNTAHRYLLQIDSDDLYAVRLQGDAGDAVLKICTITGKVIKKMQIKQDGTAFIDNIYLKSSNYLIVVESRDKGKGKYNTDYTLSAHKLQTLYPKIDNSDDSWKAVSLWEGSAVAENIDNWLGVGDQADFFKIPLDFSNGDPAYLSIELDAKTTQALNDGILQFTCCDERGRSIALYEATPGELNTRKAVSGSEIYIGVKLKKQEESVDYSFNTSLAAKF